MDYAEARRRRVIIEAALLKLEVAEREAQRVDAAAVETSRRREVLEVEAQLLRLPDKLAPAIAAERNTFKVDSILTAAIRAALERLARG